jgi:hypothetical protein
LDVEVNGFRTKKFDDRYFGSVQAHTKLMLSSGLYQAFSNYRFILIYHLDALVFSDQLEEWCDREFDFIGPPWIKDDAAPYRGFSPIEGRVGNGGFSLRKVESFLKVIHSKKRYKSPPQLKAAYFESRALHQIVWNIPKFLLKCLGHRNSVQFEMSIHRFNEDDFWASRAVHYYPEFNIAPVETALGFAFECLPRTCFKKNNHQLPFGCHAWKKYDPSFWEPYLLPEVHPTGE